MSASALACPSLAGFYSSCRSTTGQQPGSQDMSITQITQNGVTLYRISSINQETQDREEQSIIADGRTYTQEHRDTNTGFTVLTQVTASCRQNILVMNNAVILNRQIVSNVAHLVSKSGGFLRWANSGQVMGRPVTDTLICE